MLARNGPADPSSTEGLRGCCIRAQGEHLPTQGVHTLCARMRLGTEAGAYAPVRTTSLARAFVLSRPRRQRAARGPMDFGRATCALRAKQRIPAS